MPFQWRVVQYEQPSKKPKLHHIENDEHPFDAIVALPDIFYISNGDIADIEALEDNYYMVFKVGEIQVNNNYNAKTQCEYEYLFTQKCKEDLHHLLTFLNKYPNCTKTELVKHIPMNIITDNSYSDDTELIYMFEARYGNMGVCFKKSTVCSPVKLYIAITVYNDVLDNAETSFKVDLCNIAPILLEIAKKYDSSEVRYINLV